MKQGLSIIDSDLHWIEPGDMYEKHIDERFRSRAPREVLMPEGRRIRMVEGKAVPRWTRDPKVSRANRGLMERMNPGLARARARKYDPPSYLYAMDTEGTCDLINNGYRKIFVASELRLPFPDHDKGLPGLAASFRSFSVS